MSVPNLLSVTFQTTTYATSRKAFAFPQTLFTAFGFGEGHPDRVALVIRTLSGETLFCGISDFISGAEVTKAETCRNLGFSQEIIVTASRAPSNVD